MSVLFSPYLSRLQEKFYLHRSPCDFVWYLLFLPVVALLWSVEVMLALHPVVPHVILWSCNVEMSHVADRSHTANLRVMDYLNVMLIISDLTVHYFLEVFLL